MWTGHQVILPKLVMLLEYLKGGTKDGESVVIDDCKCFVLDILVDVGGTVALVLVMDAS